MPQVINDNTGDVLHEGSYSDCDYFIGVNDLRDCDYIYIDELDSLFMDLMEDE